MGGIHVVWFQMYSPARSMPLAHAAGSGGGYGPHQVAGTSPTAVCSMNEDHASGGWRSNTPSGIRHDCPGVPLGTVRYQIKASSPRLKGLGASLDA